MNLLTKQIRSELPKLYAQDGKGDEAIVYVKFFTPDSNWTWYATEGEDVIDEETGEVSYAYTAHQKDEFVKLFNDVVELDSKDVDEYEINYDWYINQCNKVIESIQTPQP